MRNTLILLAMMGSALAVQGAQVEARSATGTTSAVVSWSSRGGREVRLLTLDATSDKAASTVQWRMGAAPSTVAVAGWGTNTNVVVFSAAGGLLASNDIVLLETAAGAVTQRTVWGASLTTNSLATFWTPFRTNLAIGSRILRKLPDAYTVAQPLAAATNATNVVLESAVGLSAGDIIALQRGSTVWTGLVHAVTSNYLVALKAPGFGEDLRDGSEIYRLSPTNVLGTMTAVGASGTSVVLTNATTLEADDDVVLLPATGGAFLNKYRTQTAQTLAMVSFTAAMGLDLAAGDQVYQTTVQSTPLGATTLRLLSGVVFTAPVGRPAQLTIDGTSACAVNNAVAVYSPPGESVAVTLSELAIYGTSGTGQLLVFDASSNIVAQINGGSFQGDSFSPKFYTWAGPSNTLSLVSGQADYIASTDCAITNLSGLISTNSTAASLSVSNSSASAIVLRVTCGPLRLFGSAATNALTIPAGKVGWAMIEASGMSRTNLSNLLER